MSAPDSSPKPLRDEVFPRVFDAHWAAVRHHVEGVVADDAVVTEIVSEVFFRAWTRLNPRRPMGRIWLLRAAEHAVKARVRRPATGSNAAAAVHAGVGGQHSPLNPAESNAVLRALSVLPERERRIIVLTYWDGLTVGEIAELSRTSATRVRRALHRANAHVRDALRSEGVIVDD
jgi:RNA polymerase sigma factor (sigma-70 family)